MIDDGIAMIKLAPDLLLPLDALPSDLRRRWDNAQSRRENGEDMRGAIKAMVREAQGALGPEILLRAAHRAPQSALNLGLDDAGPLSTARGK